MRHSQRNKKQYSLHDETQQHAQDQYAMHVEAEECNSPGIQMLTFSAMAVTIPDRCELMPLDCSQFQNFSQCSLVSTFGNKTNKHTRYMINKNGATLLGSSVAVGMPLRQGTLLLLYCRWPTFFIQKSATWLRTYQSLKLREKKAAARFQRVRAAFPPTLAQ